MERDLEAEERRRIETMTNVRSFSRWLTASLPEGVDLLMLSPRTKTAVKVQLLREALLWRQEELARNAVDSLERGEVVVPAMLTRAAMETAALLVYIYEAVEKAINGGITPQLDEKLYGILTGSKSIPESPGAINVLTLIDRVTRKIPMFRVSYDSLSEATHPNWAGVHGAYSSLDQASMTVSYRRGGSNFQGKALVALLPLAGSLDLFISYYGHLGELLPEFVRVCEDAISAG